MTPQQQAEAIVEKYFLITGYKESAIMCAIEEVKACIELLNILERNDSYYQQILEHLKQM